jgi:hypothetical protein
MVAEGRNLCVSEPRQAANTLPDVFRQRVTCVSGEGLSYLASISGLQSRLVARYIRWVQDGSRHGEVVQ